MDPDTGALTSGDSGKGRFPETSAIIATFTDSTLAPSDLQGKKVIVTAGGTREAIDPVRFIGNRSSGKQGVAIAEAALRRGAHVTLIAANIEIDVDPRIALVRVESALQMSQELKKHFPLADFLFMAAAVADARVQTIHGEKIKKRDFSTIELVENPDLLQTLSDVKSKQVVLAFAAETDISGDMNEAIKAARIKMTRKGADFIFLNDVSHGGIFGSDETAGWIVSSDEELQVPLCSKKHLAHLLINRALSRANQLS
jgi:phosphopantothenoylcysteine decarboxylase/phosphopantothenate--cysteine ligase